MNDCLAGKKKIPDRREKIHDWDVFTNLMLSTWICHFTNNNFLTNKTANEWAMIVSLAFGVYNQGAYEVAYQDIFGKKPRGGRFIDFVNFC